MTDDQMRRATFWAFIFATAGFALSVALIAIWRPFR